MPKRAYPGMVQPMNSWWKMRKRLLRNHYWIVRKILNTSGPIFDHICGIHTEQIDMDVVSIVEVLFCSSKMELPHFEKVYVSGDNAGTYLNNLIPLVSLFIMQQFRISLKLLIDSKAQAWKRPVDSPLSN